MDKLLIQRIQDRKVAIYADIYLDKEKKAKLAKFMTEVAPDGDTRFLRSRDLFFSYDKERKMWNGSKDTKLPYIRMEDF